MAWSVSLAVEVCSSVFSHFLTVYFSVSHMKEDLPMKRRMSGMCIA